MFCPVLLDDQLVAFTDWNSPNGRVISIDFNRPEQENWRVVVPESDAKIQNFDVAGNLIFLTYLRNLASRVEAFEMSGGGHRILSPMARGTADIIRVSSRANESFFQYSSFASPPAIFSYDSNSGRQELWYQQRVPFDASSIQMQEVHYISRDGTQVPMLLVSQNSALGRSPLPTLLTAYGGFGHSFTPQFSPLATFLIERGCIFAVAYIRGGGEFGEEWHQAGKRHKRQNAIDDFVAAAEWLVAQNYTPRERLAIAGGSNGGLLVGAALTQRPELYCAVLCLGPLLDMLRYHKFDEANLWVDEYGTAENAADFAALKAYSPYHNVNKGMSYPAVMFVSGDSDTRCNPMHVRKMAAQLQAATSSERHILVDYKSNRGHVPVQSLSRRIDAVTDRLAFLCQELRVNF